MKQQCSEAAQDEEPQHSEAGRLTNLSMLKIHYGKQINIGAAVDTFAAAKPRVGCALSRLY